MTGWTQSHPAHARNCSSRFFREHRHRSPCNGRKDSGHATNHVRAVAFPCAAFSEVCLADKNAVRHDHTLARVRKRAPYAEPSVSVRICCLACRRQPDSFTLLDLSASDLRLSLSRNTRVPATAHAILTGVDHDNTPEQASAYRGSVFTHCIHLNSVPDPGTLSAAILQRRDCLTLPSARSLRISCPRPARSIYIAPARMNPSSHPGAHALIVAPGRACSHHCAHAPGLLFRRQPLRARYRPGSPFALAIAHAASSHSLSPRQPSALAIAPAASPHSLSPRQPLRTRCRAVIFSPEKFSAACARSPLPSCSIPTITCRMEGGFFFSIAYPASTAFASCDHASHRAPQLTATQGSTGNTHTPDSPQPARYDARPGQLRADRTAPPPGIGTRHAEEPARADAASVYFSVNSQTWQNKKTVPITSHTRDRSARANIRALAIFDIHKHLTLALTAKHLQVLCLRLRSDDLPVLPPADRTHNVSVLDVKFNTFCQRFQPLARHPFCLSTNIQ